MLAVLALTVACSLHSEIAAPRDQLALDHQIEVLRPARGETLDFAAVQQQPACDRFTASGGTPNFGGAGGGIWLRFGADLSAAPLANWRLVLPFPGLARVCVYWPATGNRARVDCADREASPAEAERWKAGRLLFTPPEDFSNGGMVHVYAESNYWLRVPLQLTTADRLLQDETPIEFGWGLYHGLLLAFSLVGLVFYFGARDRALLFFALHVAALSLALLLWHGQLTHLDLADHAISRLIFVMAGGFVAAGSRFYQVFLDTARHERRAHRLLDVCLWTGLALSALVWIWPQPVTQLVGVLGVVWIGAILWPTYLRAREGYKPAKVLLAVILVLLLGIFFAATSAMGAPVLASDLAEHLVQFGALLSTGLLSLGMMLRVRGLIAERDQASEVATANQKLAMHRLSHDETTGLPKLSKFREDLQERLKDARRNSRKLALVSLSFDNLRSLSHAVSREDHDEAIAETALRLRASMAADELLACTAADSFVWLTGAGNATDNFAELRARCQQLRNALGAPLARARGASLHVSMGVACYPQHSSTAEALLRNSDEALYKAQQQEGSGVTEIFQATMSGHSERNLELSKDLQQAILRSELELYFQPIVPLDGSGMFAAEALLRWRYKDKLITPDLFVPTAEASGLIIPMSDWVLRQAGRQISEWRRRKLPVLSVSVNISAQEFRSEGFVQRVESALKETTAPGSGLVLELTEGMLVDDLPGAAEILNHLARGGVKAAVDDFGVGYSSLSYLRSLPAQGIKIDRSFLKGIPQEQEAVSVLSAIITMGRELGLKITAEGIETEEQMRFLSRRGVTAGQGWLFAKAMPAKQFEAWIAEAMKRPIGG